MQPVMFAGTNTTSKSFLMVMQVVKLACVMLILNVTIAAAQTAKPTPQPNPTPTPRKPLPKLSNGARGFNSTNKDSNARLIAIGGGYGAGEDEEALPKLKRKTAQGYYAWGLELSYRTEMNGAIAALEKATKLNPDYVSAYWRLGEIYSEYNNLVDNDESKYDNKECYRRAIIAFENVKRLRPRRAGVYNNLGVLYFNTGQFEKAVEAFQKGLSLKVKGKPNDVTLMENETLEDHEIYVFIGDAYERLDKNDLALEYYGRVRPEENVSIFVTMEFRIGSVYEKLGETKKAIAAYEAIDPTEEYPFYRYGINSTADFHARFGLLYAADQNFEKAVVQLGKAVQGFVTALNDHLKSEPLDEDSQKLKEDWLNELLAIKNSLATASYNLGVVYLSAEKPEDALMPFQKAVEVDPANVEARFNLGFAYYSSGNTDAARVQVEALKLLDKDHALELERLITK